MRQPKVPSTSPSQAIGKPIQAEKKKRVHLTRTYMVVEFLKPNYFKKQRFSSPFLLTCSKYTGIFWPWRTLQATPMHWRNGTSLRPNKNVASWNILALASHGKIIVNSCMLKCSTAEIVHYSDLFQSKFFLKAYSKWKIWIWSSYSKEKIIWMKQKEWIRFDLQLISGCL